MNEDSLFPFTAIRGGQKEFLDDVRSVIESAGVLLAHAPTGIGKTVAALVPALEYALKNDKVVFFLTPKQSQHKIAVDTLRLIKRVRRVDITAVDVISKQAMCPRDISREHYAVFNEICKFEQKTRKCKYFRKYDRSVTDRIAAEIMHVEELKKLCTRNGVCPHRTALDAAKRGNVVICDYNYLFSDISETILDTLNLDLGDIILIVDEAHNLPERIRGHLSDDLTLNSLKEASREMHSIDEIMYRHLRGIDKFFNELVGDTPEGTEQSIEKNQVIDGVNKVLGETLGEPMTYTEFIESLGRIGLDNEKEGLAILGVAKFLGGWMTDIPCSRIFSNEATPRMSFRLLDPSILSQDIISGVHAAVMMSGTLYPTEMYADILGANSEKTLLKEYKSPFPTENRLIVVTEGLTTRYTERSEEMYQNIAGKITEISGEVDGSLAVFFPSYALLESIADYIPKKRTLVERRHMSKGQKNRLYNQLRSGGGILLGVQAGSLSEGVDYEDNILKAVIIVGLPLSPPTLEVRNLQRYYAHKFGKEKGELYSYIYPAIGKVLQAGGRGIRSEVDVGVIVLMDYRFMYPTYRKCFPPDYSFKLTDKPEELCRKFFKEVVQVPKPVDEERYRYMEHEELTTKLPLSLQILKLIRDLGGKLGRNKVAGILKGSRSKYILLSQYDRHECYGILSDLKTREAGLVVDELIERGYVTRGGDPAYPTINLSEKGATALTGEEGFEIETLSRLKKQEKEKTQAEQKKPQELEESSPAGNMELFEALRAWRLKEAGENNAPPYTIFHNKTLRQLAMDMPETREQLQGIYGIGEEKMKKYGIILLKIIGEFRMESKGISSVDNN
ncbi:MAG: helicase C-terminal domain-containing protein [Candidatus Altiarchaeota archaeon]|nr:helicase C-terminal domain-containing protein [Candidatus Altiarchaeota archaeon]